MDPYATHLPVTVAALKRTGELYPDLPILELGCGDYSTPIIRSLKGDRRHFVISSDPDWSSRYKGLADHIRLIEPVEPRKWPELTLNESYGLCLLDNEELVSHRLKHVVGLLKAAKVVIVHDARKKAHAKYSYLYTDYTPYTWMGSNVIDVTTWL